MLRRAVALWSGILLRTFRAWVKYKDLRRKDRTNALYMLCWKSREVFREWRVRSREAVVRREQKELARVLGVRAMMRFYLRRWAAVHHASQKIARSCRLISDRFKGIAAGLGLFRRAWYRRLTRLSLLRWSLDTKLLRKHDLAVKWHGVKSLHLALWAWRMTAEREIEARDHERNAKEQQEWLSRVIDDMDSEVKRIELERETPPPPDTSSRDQLIETRKKARRRRDVSAVSGDRGILAAQRQLRRERVVSEKAALVSTWEGKWTQKSEQACGACLSRTNAWLLGAESKNVLLKGAKQLHREFFMAPTSGVDAREKMLSSPACQCLAIIDGKLAHKGFIPTEFFRKLEEGGVDNLVHYDALIETLHNFTIFIDPPLVRSLYDEMSDTGNTLKIGQLKARMGGSYKYIGAAGLQWKQYVSLAHETMVFHDTFADTVSLH